MGPGQASCTQRSAAAARARAHPQHAVGAGLPLADAGDLARRLHHLLRLGLGQALDSIQLLRAGHGEDSGTTACGRCPGLGVARGRGTTSCSARRMPAVIWGRPCCHPWWATHAQPGTACVARPPAPLPPARPLALRGNMTRDSQVWKPPSFAFLMSAVARRGGQGRAHAARAVLMVGAGREAPGAYRRACGSDAPAAWASLGAPRQHHAPPRAPWGPHGALQIAARARARARARRAPPRAARFQTAARAAPAAPPAPMPSSCSLCMSANSSSMASASATLARRRCREGPVRS
jgi:hypothetical protein